MNKGQKLNILYLEDSAEDITLVKRELSKGRLDYNLSSVDSRDEYISALKETHPDIILSDHSLPQFNSLEALKICRGAGIKVPFILVTGTVSEEFAALSILKGADDYILKSNLTRLPTSILQALKHRDEENRREEAEIKIIRQNQELLKINDEFDVLIYNISHQLRAPLRSLLGLLNLAKIDRQIFKSDTLSNYLERMEESTLSLDRVLCNIRDYSENTRRPIMVENIVLHNLIIDTYEHCIKEVEGETLIDFHLKIEQSCDFASDKHRLRNIFSQLISNALIYQKPDNMHKELYIKGVVSKQKAELLILDNGIGIKREFHEDIFKMFVRATSRGIGSGLGLFIVRELIEKLSGKIALTSEEDQGTTFYISIPNLIIQD